MFNYSLDGVIEVEDTVTAYLELGDGVKGIFFATNAYAENSAPFFEVSFEKGTARYMDKKLWVNGALLEEDKAPTTGKAYWGDSHTTLLKNYYDESKYFTVVDAKMTMETVFAMYESAKK